LKLPRTHDVGSPTRPADGTPRPLRADAQRNRDRLVGAARAALAKDEGALTCEGVARDAGVGVGTLYRHFPNLGALVEAVYSAELDQLAATAPGLLDDFPPDEALRTWAERYVRFTATQPGLRPALSSGMASGTIPAPHTREVLTRVVADFLASGARGGSLRTDVSPQAATSLLLGVMLSIATEPAHDAGSDRIPAMVGLFVDALRAPTASLTANPFL